MKQTLSAFLLAVSICPGFLAAQNVEHKSTPVFDAKDPAISRRIMLGVASPVETLAGPFLLGPQVQGRPYDAAAHAGAAGGAALGGPGSLIGVLIVTGARGGKERAAAEFAAGVNQALAGMDMRRELAEQLRKELGRTGYLKGASLEEVTDTSDLEQAGLLVRIKERDIFTLDVRGVFDRRMTSLHVFTGVRLWRKDEFQPLYAGRLHYVSRNFTDEQAARQRWIADNGALLMRTLREGIAETARMFVADAAVRTAGGGLPDETAKASWIAAETGKKIWSSIHMLLERDDRLLGKTMFPAEEMISIPRENATAFEEAAKP